MVGSRICYGVVRAAPLLLLLGPLFHAAGAQPNAGDGAAAGASSEFVSRSGADLMLAGRKFRFGGANIFWLGLDAADGTAYRPSRFRIDDVLDAAKEIGATVVRSHSLGISVGCPACIEPALGSFNEAGFESADYAIQAAGARHIRLIIPLIDNWRYYTGGKHTFTEWRGLANEDAFFTDANVIDDFKAYISHILGHVNPLTGLAYKDDPTIMMWETGDELETADGRWSDAWTAQRTADASASAQAPR